MTRTALYIVPHWVYNDGVFSAPSGAGTTLHTIPLEKFYIDLMTRWTKELDGIAADSNTELLLGVPAYKDTGVGYHRPGYCE